MRLLSSSIHTKRLLHRKLQVSRLQLHVVIQKLGTMTTLFLKEEICWHHWQTSALAYHVSYKKHKRRK